MPDIITRTLLESKGIPTRDIVAAIWGRKLSGGYEPAEATGTLPLTFRSDGTALLDYRIYGSTVDGEGVGVQTENLFDPNAAEEDGDKIISDFMPLDPSGQYITIAFDIEPRTFYNYEITYYDSTKTAISFVGGMGEAYKTREAVKLNWQSEAPNAAYVKVTLPKDLFNVLIQNGSTSGAYIPYGYKFSMVSRSENLFDVELEQGGWSGTNGKAVYKSGSADTQFYPKRVGSTLVIPIGNPEKTYTVSVFPSDLWITCKIVNASGIQTSDTGWHTGNAQIGPGAYYGICVTIRNANNTALNVNDVLGVTITESSTAPGSYIPYRRTDTPIYIGNTQLMQDEYVSYSEQKIYREVGGTLTPTDPPVPLPELPTFSDTDTVLDYEETPAPEEVWVKYLVKKGD